MAKGSVKKFFDRLYETETLKRKSIQQSFLCALNRLFTCATKKTNKEPLQLNRSCSWSPSYDVKENFLSEEEKRLRWAFRKNQPGFSPGKLRRQKKFFSPIGYCHFITLIQKNALSCEVFNYKINFVVKFPACLELSLP